MEDFLVSVSHVAFWNLYTKDNAVSISVRV